MPKLSRHFRWQVRIGVLLLLLLNAVWMLAMPGSSARAPLPEATAELRLLASDLESDVRALSEGIGERNLHCPGSLDEAADWIEARLRAAGYVPQRQRYELSGDSIPRYAGHTADNLVAELPGRVRPEEIVIVGAHYDTVPGSPGANDNGSGVAVLLALAARFAERPQPRTVRFVAFANEEPPFYQTRDMGSHAYARESRRRGEPIIAMIALDGLGKFSDQPGSQQYPVPGLQLRYPRAGNFIGLITRFRDARLLRRALAAFREQATVPSEGAALPAWLPGVGWSDHWSFWVHGYPAFLVTDTLPFRDPHYHTSRDTPERLDYDRMARVTEGLEAVIRRLAE